MIDSNSVTLCATMVLRFSCRMPFVFRLKAGPLPSWFRAIIFVRFFLTQKIECEKIKHEKTINLVLDAMTAGIMAYRKLEASRQK